MVFIEDLSTDPNNNNVNKVAEDITVFITEPEESEAPTAEQQAPANPPGVSEAAPLRFAARDEYEIMTPSSWPVQVPLPWHFVALKVTVCLRRKRPAHSTVAAAQQCAGEVESRQ